MKLSKEDKFCPGCGKDLSVNDVPSENNSEESLVVAEEVPKCKECGAELSEENKFCPECGVEITDDE